MKKTGKNWGQPQKIINCFGLILSHLKMKSWGMLHLLALQYQYPKNNMDPHIHPFNGPLSGTTRMSRYQKGKPIWTLLKQETVSSSGISWAICKSAPHSRQIITPAPHHSVFYRPDALPATQPTASKHWRHKNNMDTAMKLQHTLQHHQSTVYYY